MPLPRETGTSASASLLAARHERLAIPATGEGVREPRRLVTVGAAIDNEDGDLRLVVGEEDQLDLLVVRHLTGRGGEGGEGCGDRPGVGLGPGEGPQFGLRSNREGERNEQSDHQHERHGEEDESESAAHQASGSTSWTPTPCTVWSQRRSGVSPSFLRNDDRWTSTVRPEHRRAHARPVCTARACG